MFELSTVMLPLSQKPRSIGIAKCPIISSVWMFIVCLDFSGQPLLEPRLPTSLPCYKGTQPSFVGLQHYGTHSHRSVGMDGFAENCISRPNQACPLARLSHIVSETSSWSASYWQTATEQLTCIAAAATTSHTLKSGYIIIVVVAKLNAVSTREAGE